MEKVSVLAVAAGDVGCAHENAVELDIDIDVPTMQLRVSPHPKSHPKSPSCGRLGGRALNRRIG